MRVALATCAALRHGYPEDVLLREALLGRGASATIEVWDDPAVRWSELDRVVIRSTWDYILRRDEYLAWAESLGEALRNRPPVVRWNSDKRYLAQLAAAGLPTVETVFVEADGAEPALAGEVVVKPAVSAGARDTGRFGPGAHDQARALLARLRAERRTAMVQPYLGSVDGRGETAQVLVAGEPSHALRKRAVLAPDEEAPIRPDAIGAAEMMWQDDLVSAGEAGPRERALAGAACDFMAERFGVPPLYVRVDMVDRDDGEPVVLEVEAIEPSLYLESNPGSAERLAAAIIAGA